MQRPQESTLNRKKKVRRVVLGVGAPWFFDGNNLHVMKLYNEPGVFHDPKWINPKGLGNWNKIRLVAEVLE